MGDHADGIGKITLMIAKEPPLKPLIDLPSMAQKTGNMLRRSLDAFINRDAETAKQISKEDDEIDALYDQGFRELLTFMAEDSKTITRATRLIWWPTIWSAAQTESLTYLSVSSSSSPVRWRR
jgi:phosphate transport system protein